MIILEASIEKDLGEFKSRLFASGFSLSKMELSDAFDNAVMVFERKDISLKLTRERSRYTSLISHSNLPKMVTIRTVSRFLGLRVVLSDSSGIQESLAYFFNFEKEILTMLDDLNRVIQLSAFIEKEDAKVFARFRSGSSDR